MQLHHEAVQLVIAQPGDINAFERVEGGIDLCTHLRENGSDHSFTFETRTDWGREQCSERLTA